jgi:predicted ATP-dependent endonuclease of OLD family
MSKSKVFVLVGHSNWGKSFTLNALTERYGDGWKKRSVIIKHELIPIKKMSNDDRPVDEIIKFAKRQIAGSKNFIIALCPNFSPDRKKDTEKLLKILKDNCKVYFMLLKRAQGDSDIRELQQSEIMVLREYGKIEPISKKIDKYVRAKKFKDFIENSLVS